jgi:hypothetical protein
LLIDLEIWREEVGASPFRSIDAYNSTGIYFVGTMFEDAKEKVKSERIKKTIGEQSGIGELSSNKNDFLDENAILKRQVK